MEGLIQIGPYDGQLAGRRSARSLQQERTGIVVLSLVPTGQGNFLKKLLPVDAGSQGVAGPNGGRWATGKRAIGEPSEVDGVKLDCCRIGRWRELRRLPPGFAARL